MSRALNWIVVIAVLCLFFNPPSAFKRIASNAAFKVLQELQQQTNGTTIIEVIKAKLDAILLNAEGGLKKRLTTPMTSTQFKVLDTFKIGLWTFPPCPLCASNVNVEFLYFNDKTKSQLWLSLASVVKCALCHSILR